MKRFTGNIGLKTFWLKENENKSDISMLKPQQGKNKLY